jgi:hypothetical protein
MFFIGEKYKPCKNYVNRREKEIEEPRRRREEEAAKKAAIKAITKPAPRPPEAPKDCLYCKRLPYSYLCQTCIVRGAYQGEGRVGEHYLEVIARPEGEDRNCLYCLVNWTCTIGTVKRNQLCERYIEYKPAEQTAVQV